MPLSTSTITPAGNGAAWVTSAPTETGFDAAKLAAAVEFAKAAESPWPRNFYYPDGRYVGIVEWNETGPWSEVAGHVRVRGGPSGLVLKGGRMVAEWGDTHRADTHRNEPCRIHFQRSAALSSTAFASTHLAPSGVCSFFQNGACVLR